MSKEGFILSGIVSMLAIFAITEDPVLAIVGCMGSLGIYAFLDMTDAWNP